MTTKLDIFDKIDTVTVAPALQSGCSSSLTNSYPQDLDRALAEASATMTGDGEKEKAFRRAGLK